MVKDTPPANVDLKALFAGLQRQLAVELEIAREHIPHNGDMGTASENRWREVLSRQLPMRYQVEKGIIIDSNGDCSHSIDIVIFDRQYTHLLMSHGGQLFIPAESVYAVLEAKQDISKRNLLYAGDKAASVRRLVRTSAPVYHVEGVAKPKPPIPILAGLIALDGGLTPLYGAPFTQIMNEMMTEPAKRLDLGCSVKQGSFEAKYTDTEVILYNSQPENSLSFFILRLMKRLQQLGTVSAIDFSAYEKWIE